MTLTIDQALQQAVAAHKEGKLEEAERLYRAILQTQPTHPDANHNLGVLAVSVNNSEAALLLFKTALDANPDQGQFWISYVDALINESQFENAKKILEQGKRRGLAGEKVDALEEQLDVSLDKLESKSSKQGEFSLAIELREAGKYQEAQEWLSRFIEAHPNDPEALSLLSQVFLLDKKDAEAGKALSNAVLINSHLPSVSRNQARLLLKQSKPAEALVKAQFGYELSPHDPEGWLVLAACLGANQRDQEALPLIEKVLQAIPNYAEAFGTRALARLRAKYIVGAIKDAEMAVSLKPHLTQVWALLGSLRYQSKNLEGAIEATKKAHELDPTNVDYMINLGEFLRQEGNVIEAITLLEEAAKLAPGNPNAWTNLGVALQQAKKTTKAELAYGKALEINPKSAEIFSNLGAIAKDSQDWKSALRHFEQSLAINPDLAEVHGNLGVALTAIGRLDDAEASIKKAISLKPEFAEAHCNLGVTLKALGRLEEAVASYRKAIALKPGYAEAHFNLGRLLAEANQYEKAAGHFMLSDFERSKHYLLRCLYLQEKKLPFYEQLDHFINQGEIHPMIGSLGCRSALRYGIERPNLYCKHPFSYVSKTDLGNQYDFGKIFVKTTRAILNENRISNRRQGLLTNGYQTSGNLFHLESDSTEEIQKIIRLEIEKYQANFEDSEEGFITSWPTDYSLYGWLVSMKSGGELRPHMHEDGWISGSIYINVPLKLKTESGNLVVCIEEGNLTGENRSHGKSIDVVTGSMCLFPASLLHYTIPFESEEERIVLAFDVVPKY
ncbi:MAG: tetratricopeptide repeat protein [Pseudohongiellaceae bacterium]